MTQSFRWIEKAGRRLELAKKQIERLKAAQSHIDFEDDWYLFLVCARNVISMIELGAAESPAVSHWFEKRRSQRHTHPVANYMHHARHDDEHGLTHVTGRAVKTSLGADDAVLGVHPTRGYPMMGFAVDQGIKRDFCQLAPVTNSNDVREIDRGTRTGPPRLIDPPTDEYLGNPAPEDQAIKAAELQIEYLLDLLEDAARAVG